MVKLEGVSSGGVGAICVFVCAGNALTLLAIGRTRSLQNKCNLLVAHLSIVDLVTGLVTWPVLTYLAEDGGSLVSCLGGHAVIIALKDVSQFLLLFVCIVMYIKIAYPLHYRRWLSVRRMHAVSMTTWLLGTTIGCMSFVWAKDGQSETRVSTCFITIMPFPYWIGLINWPFVAVSVSILVMYVRIIRIARRHLLHHGSGQTQLLAAAAAATTRFTYAAAAASADEANRGDRPSVVNIIPSITVQPSSVRRWGDRRVLVGDEEDASGNHHHQLQQEDRTVVSDKTVQFTNEYKVNNTTLESDRNKNYSEFNRNDRQHQNQQIEVFCTESSATVPLPTISTERAATIQTPTVTIENEDISTNDKINDNHEENTESQSNSSSMEATSNGTRITFTLSGAVEKLINDDNCSPEIDEVKHEDTNASIVPKLTKLNLGLRPSPSAGELNVSPSPEGDGGAVFSFPASPSSSSISSIVIETDPITSPSRCSVVSLASSSHVTGVRGGAGRGSQGGAGVGGTGKRKSQGPRSHELQLVVTMLVTYMAFVVCWLPLEVAVYCTSLGLITDTSHSAFVEFSLALSLTNSGINVLIYSWRYVTFRKAIRAILTCSRYNNASARASATAASAANKRLSVRQASGCHMYN